MDLYEALKNGVSAEELIKTFNNDMEEAKKRLEQEKKKEKAEARNKNRTKFASAISDYLAGCLDESCYDALPTIAELEELLKGFEEEMQGSIGLIDELSKVFDNNNNNNKKEPVGVEIKTYSTDPKNAYKRKDHCFIDTKILDEFIKGL